MSEHLTEIRIRQINSQQGQVVIEFALVLPILLLLLFGVFTFGWWLYVKLVVHHAASQAAKELSVTNQNNRAVEAGLRVLSQLPASDAASITLLPPMPQDKDRRPGGQVAVKIVYPNPLVLLPFLSDEGETAALLRDVGATVVQRMECNPSITQGAYGFICPPAFP